MGTRKEDAILVPSDDSDGEDRYQSISGDNRKIAFRGPNKKGELDFDDYCFFGNDMILIEDQMDFLSYWCAESGPEAKYYLYRMTKSSVIEKKCKLVVGAEFTRACLEFLLEKPVNVVVECMSSRKKFNVKMKKATFTNNAIMTSGWGAVFERYKIEEEEIVLFDFFVKDDGDMIVQLVKLGKSYSLD